MRLDCPGEKEIPLWDTCGAESVTVALELVAGARSARGADGRMPHLVYRVGNAGQEHKIITCDAGSIRTFADSFIQYEFDCGQHHLPWAGALYLTGGNPSVKIDLALFREPPIVRPDSFQWPSDSKTATRRTLTTLVPASGTMFVPRLHDQIGAWITRAGTLVEGQPATLDHVGIPCIPGSLVQVPAGNDLLIFTSVLL